MNLKWIGIDVSGVLYFCMNYMFDKNKDWLAPSGAEYHDEYHNELLLYIFHLLNIILREPDTIFSTLFYIFFCTRSSKIWSDWLYCIGH